MEDMKEQYVIMVEELELPEEELDELLGASVSPPVCLSRESSIPVYHLLPRKRA